MENPKKIVAVGIGEILLDRDAAKAASCGWAESEKLGGAPANFAYHFKQCAEFILRPQGFDPAVYAVSAVGEKSGSEEYDRGQRILDEIGALGIGGYVERLPGEKTGLVDKRKDADGVNTYTIYPAAWDKLEWSERLADLARRTDVVCFGSLAQRDLDGKPTRMGVTIRQFVETVGARDCRTWRIFDVNIRQDFYSQKVLEESILLCNILKISDEECGKVQACLTGYDLCADSGMFCQALLTHYPNLEMVVLTEGAAGSTIYTRDRISGFVIPLQSRKKPVDTVGAGDSFTAAYCAMLVRGADIWPAQQTASAVAAYVCQHQSATPSYPANPGEVFGLTE